MLPEWNPRHDMIRQLASMTPFNQEEQNRLADFLIVGVDIVEAHKNELTNYSTYAIIRGSRVIEGSPADIGYAEKQTLPIIFSVRIIVDKTDKKVIYKAYSTTARCVAEATTRKKVIKAIQTEIIQMFTLEGKELPDPIVMKVADCSLNGELWLYEGVKESQEKKKAFIASEKAYEERRHLYSQV